MFDLKTLSKKQKAEYIWDYYKIHIIAAVAIIVIAVSLIHSSYTKIDYVFNLTIIGNMADENKIQVLQKRITSIVVKDGNKRKQAMVDVIPTNSASSPGDIMQSQYMQKFVVRMSVGELDVIVLDKSMVDTLVKQDRLLRLDNIGQLNLASIKNDKIYASGEDNKRLVYAISAKDIKIFKDEGIDTSNKVMGIISSCKQKDKAAELLEVIANK